MCADLSGAGRVAQPIGAGALNARCFADHRVIAIIVEWASTKSKSTGLCASLPSAARQEDDVAFGHVVLCIGTDGRSSGDDQVQRMTGTGSRRSASRIQRQYRRDLLLLDGCNEALDYEGPIYLRIVNLFNGVP